MRILNDRECAFDGDVPGFDVVSKVRTMTRYGKPTLVVMQHLIDDLFIDIDALEAVTA